jgi:hypothetical protein
MRYCPCPDRDIPYTEDEFITRCKHFAENGVNPYTQKKLWKGGNLYAVVAKACQQKGVSIDHAYDYRKRGTFSYEPSETQLRRKRAKTTITITTNPYSKLPSGIDEIDSMMNGFLACMYACFRAKNPNMPSICNDKDIDFNFDRTTGKLLDNEEGEYDTPSIFTDFTCLLYDPNVTRQSISTAQKHMKSLFMSMYPDLEGEDPSFWLHVMRTFFRSMYDVIGKCKIPKHTDPNVERIREILYYITVPSKLFPKSGIGDFMFHFSKVMQNPEFGRPKCNVRDDQGDGRCREPLEDIRALYWFKFPYIFCMKGEQDGHGSYPQFQHTIRDDEIQNCIPAITGDAANLLIRQPGEKQNFPQLAAILTQKNSRWVAYIRDRNDWYEYDDRKISVVKRLPVGTVLIGNLGFFKTGDLADVSDNDPFSDFPMLPDPLDDVLGGPHVATGSHDDLVGGDDYGGDGDDAPNVPKILPRSVSTFTTRIPLTLRRKSADPKASASLSSLSKTLPQSVSTSTTRIPLTLRRKSADPRVSSSSSSLPIKEKRRASSQEILELTRDAEKMQKGKRDGPTKVSATSHHSTPTTRIVQTSHGKVSKGRGKVSDREVKGLLAETMRILGRPKLVSK